MGLLDELSDASVWDEFRTYKSLHSHMSNREFRQLDDFIAERRYLAVTERLDEPDHGFSLPLRRTINKSGSRKKRVIYTFPEDQTYVLKLLTWLLYRYDQKIHPSCYSFRRSVSAKCALDDIRAIPRLGSKYALKADIHDYFNSMPVEGLVEVLGQVVDDDPELLRFLTDFLSVGAAFDGHTIVHESRGAMAGVPVSAFLANVYLLSLDELFARRGVPYFRYSDDIILFADSAEELAECRQLLEAHIVAKGLELNPEKTQVSGPGEPWEFLGFRYCDGQIDLSTATLKKMKDKIRRKCRALYRWRLKKDVGFDRAAKVVVRIFNQKYYDVDGFHDFTWSKWFFPVLTTTDGLRTLDEYLVENLRYIYSGRHFKGNYAITYDHLKSLGLRSLVHEYYLFKAGMPAAATEPGGADGAPCDASPDPAAC